MGEFAKRSDLDSLKNKVDRLEGELKVVLKTIKKLEKKVEDLEFEAAEKQ